MEKIFELARKFRLALFIITVAAFAIVATAKCNAFWPPDMVPHGPHFPEPEKHPDDHIS